MSRIQNLENRYNKIKAKADKVRSEKDFNRCHFLMTWINWRIAYFYGRADKPCITEEMRNDYGV